MNALVTELRNLNYSNTLDGEAHNWGALMNCLDDALDPECDNHALARRLKREGLAEKAELMRAIESTLEERIKAMQILLGQVKGLK